MTRLRAAVAVLALALAFVTAACAPLVIPGGAPQTEPALVQGAVRVADRARLPMRSWLPAEGPPRAVIVAVHGFNDYSNFFAEPGAWLAERGIATYAYDQRGFGKAPNRGIWPGTATLVRDLDDVVKAVRARHPGVPLTVLGESMGGAVALVAMTGPAPPDADSLILVAPAVRGRVTMPLIERWALEASAHTLPALTVTGRGLGIQPSDNIEMLRALARDPNMIHETRIDTVYGLVDLMDAAQAAAPRLKGRTLILYGERDELVPPAPTQYFFSHLPPSDGGAAWRIAIYEGGYHMLLRDLDGARAWADIAAWITDPNAPLPSGADARAATPPTCRNWKLCDKVPAPSPGPPRS